MVGTPSNRAGTYVRQQTGYSAFIPRPLPPDPPLQFDDEMQTLLSKADRALGRLDGSIQTLPNPDLFVFMYVRKEAVLSSQIEGTQSSLSDVLQAEASILDPNRPHDAIEVINYVNAMNYGLERLQTLPLSSRLVREIHERLLRNVRGRNRQPGEIRTTQNWIGPENSLLTDAIFIPPPPHEVPQALSDLERFIHSDPQLPELIKIGLIHSQFETIHPFLDGNGRIGRLLVTFLLCMKTVLIRPVLYLSHYLRENRSEYYNKLQRVRDYGECEEWIKFFLEGIAKVSLEATDTARNIVQLREGHRANIIADFRRAAGNGLKVYERLFERPMVTVNNVSEILGITFAAANTLVDRFVTLGILKEITGQKRYRVFSFDGYVSLFSDSRSA